MHYRYWLSEGQGTPRGRVGDPTAELSELGPDRRGDLPGSSTAAVNEDDGLSGGGHVGGDGSSEYSSLLAKFTDGRAAAALAQRGRGQQGGGAGRTGEGMDSEPWKGKEGTEAQVQQAKADVFANAVWALSVLVRKKGKKISNPFEESSF